METIKNDFSQGSVRKTIIKLAIPLILAQIVNALYNIVDRIFIGQIPEIGRTALTGIGVAAPVILIASAFALLWGIGGTPLSSIERGKGNLQKAEHYMGNSFVMIILTGIVVSLILYFVKDKALFLCGASDETFVYANNYLSICLIGMVFSMIALGMNGFINAQGFPKIGMLTVIIGAVINIILDPIFIFVFDMNVKGAAIATVISQTISALWVIIFLTSKKAIMHLSFASFKLNGQMLIKMLGLGASEFVMKITTCLIYMAINASLLFYGGDIYVTAGTVVNSVRDLALYPLSGFSNGAQPFLSYNYGAKRNERVCEGIKFLAIACIAIAILTEICIMAFPQAFVSIFNTDSILMEVAVPSLRIFFSFYIILSLQMAGQVTFVGLGYSKHAIFFSIFRKVVVMLPLLLILPKFMGVNGIFWSEPISDLIGGLCCFISMYFIVYRRLKNET